MELTLLYLATRLDDIANNSQVVFGWLTIGLVFLIGSQIIIHIFYPKSAVNQELLEKQNYDNHLVYVWAYMKPRLNRATLVLAIVASLAGLLRLATPSTGDAALIAAGYGLTKIVQDEQVKTIFGKSTSIVEQWLDEKIKEAKKSELEPNENTSSTKVNK